MKRHASCVVLATASIILSSPLFAADSGVTIAPVIVTATRTAQTADEALASVSVITREEIERRQPESLTTLLGQIQGVEITRNGDRGNTSNVFIRGTESDHVIVLIDGVRVGSATTGTTAFEYLPLGNIERIEVVRGPRSSLYGADAIGGVIQIFTRASDGPRVGTGAGSHDLHTATAGWGMSDGDTQFSVDLAFEETDGFDARENNCMFCADEPDDDGYRSHSLSMRGRHPISDKVALSGNLLLVEGENEFDGTLQNRSEFFQAVGGANLDWQINRRWDTTFGLGTSVDDNENFLDEQEKDPFRTERDQFTWQNDITIGPASLVTAGVDVVAEHVESEVSGASYDETRRDTTGIFVQHQWTGARWDTQLSARYSAYDDFEDQTTGSIALGYGITEGLRAFGSLGTAFKAPSFNELYYPGFGNPDLDPEKSRSAEVGLRGSAGPLGWEATVYRTDIEDLIVTAQTPSGLFLPQNINKAQIDGLEFTIDGRWQYWNAAATAGFKDPEDVESGNQLVRRAEQTLDTRVSRQLGAWTVGTGLTYRGKRFDDAANKTELDPYTLLDLRASWRFSPDWIMRFKIANATNEEYTLADTYNTDDRSFLIQVDWRPGGR